MKYEFSGIFYDLVGKSKNISNKLKTSIKKENIDLGKFYIYHGLDVEKCRICKNSYPPIEFDCYDDNGIIKIRGFKYLKDKIYCYGDNRSCPGIKMNSNSVEFISRVLKISKKKALEFIKKRNKSPFYRENWKSDEEYSNYQKRDSTYFKNKFGRNWEIEYDKYKKKISYSNSLEGYVNKYGESTGKDLFEFVSKRKDSMTFNHFLSKNNNDLVKAKFEYDQRLKSVSVNLESFINRYGKDVGTEKYISNRNRISESLKDRCNSMTPEERKLRYGVTPQNLLRKYGDYELAKEVYDRWISSVTVPITRASKESMTVFSRLIEYVKEIGILDSDIFVGFEDKREFFIKDSEKIFFYDFTVRSKKIIIEYNGVAFHPKLEKIEEFKPIYGNKSSIELYEHHRYKLEVAESRGFKILEIWSDEENNFEKCVDFIEKNIRNGNC